MGGPVASLISSFQGTLVRTDDQIILAANFVPSIVNAGKNMDRFLEGVFRESVDLTWQSKLAPNVRVGTSAIASGLRDL